MNLKEKILNFINKSSDKQKLIVIYWPTASWKTSMSIDVAKILNSEIISTDSRQIFKFMDIGTAKITDNEKSWIKHHMIDIIEPNIDYSVWEYKKEAELIMDKLFKDKKIPILCGGTWLYIDSLIYDFKIPSIAADWKLRKQLEKEASDFWNEYVYNKLLKIDPKYAKELHPNNINYVIRAIEVMLLTGKSKSESKTEKKLKYDVLFLTPYDDNKRKELYERINKRVDLMIEKWLEDEIKKLFSMWFKSSDFWLKTIWYREYIDFLNGNISKIDSINIIKQNSRNYAKRQNTWFKKYETGPY